MCVFLFCLLLAIVVPLAMQSKKERPRLVAYSEARQSLNNSNKPGRKIRSEPKHCCSLKLAVSLYGAIQPRKIWDYVRIKLCCFVPCASCSGVDGYAKLPCNILLRGAFFKYRTFFSGKSNERNHARVRKNFFDSPVVPVVSVVWADLTHGLGVFLRRMIDYVSGVRNVRTPAWHKNV